MSSIDKLTLISGINILIPELKVEVHQPTIRDIAYIGERNFYFAAQILTTKKDSMKLSEEDKVDLSTKSDFEVIMSIVISNLDIRVPVAMLLALLFPDYTVDIEERFILLAKHDGSGTAMINDSNFSEFQETVKTILCLGVINKDEDFNPQSEQARLIAEKLKKAREKVARLKGNTGEKESSILSRYISGLGIATNSLSIKEMLNLTLYQLFDQVKRFELYTAFDISIKAKMAGAKDVEDVDWLKDIN